LPLYRQQAIYARDQVELDRSLMAQWMGKVGFELEPLADYLFSRIKQGERVFADETTLPTLAPGSGQVKTAYLWAYARDDRPIGGTAPPMVAYRFEDSRSGDCVARHLEGYGGILQVDGYAAYHRQIKPDRANAVVTLAGCWAHVRRKFYELHASDRSPVATQAVQAMAPLWAIEESVRGQAPEIRRKDRQEQSGPIVSALFASWEKELPRLSGSRNWLKPSVMPSAGTRCSAALSRMGGSRSTPTSSSVPSAPRPSPARMPCSPVPMAAAAPGQPSPR
jgi:transposase